ncbi:YggS family pyridoxal phosphate-dependent enzyme [Methyloligella sp. 2.7D]|uniref:YggS family pyridoxal phosphate-dependent enzyme n=1 Tax=unclassified Methyloligella TaxID=2625955 RepID=UPI00157D4DBD|nr:YggS family pyridoxal phosphate-dependent enzyme [Methyloligella sp. GL2]QKP76261.1 YggS family pyridoxal phosphate-dependent enzyme [Methyloligella sp. GL2]
MTATINTDTDTVTGRLEAVRAEIETAARQAGRDPANVHLIAVSKTHPAEAVEEAITAGQRVFGENRVQEAKAKFEEVRESHPDVVLHIIGPLQSNKVKEAVAIADWIHSVDRPKIARAIAAEMKEQERTPKLLIQVNTGEEPQKAGVVPGELGAFLEMCRGELGLKIEGLMCIPPVDEEPSLHFALLAKLAEEHGLNELSMGMSGDYETAIQFGATFIRVGTAIFGARDYPTP